MQFSDFFKTIFASCSINSLIICITIFSGPALNAQSLILNEVFARADDSTPEWIELYNYGTADTDLQDWSIADKSSARQIPPAVVPANSYVLLTSDTSRLRQRYSPPAAALLIEMRIPSLNNGGDALGLRDAHDNLRDSMQYSKSLVIAATSIERVEIQSEGLDKASWELSTDAGGATPGRRNSVTPLDLDLACTQVLSDGKSIVVECSNLGRRAITNIQLQLSLYQESNQVFAVDTLLGDAAGPGGQDSLDSHALTLLPGTSTHITFQHKIHKSAWLDARAHVIGPGDEQPGNDKLETRLWLTNPNTTVLFSEIMFRPLAHEAEYLELFNAGTDTIDLREWQITHFTSSNNIDSLILNIPQYCGTSVLLAPQDYMAVAWDSAIFAQFAGLNECDNALFIEDNFNLRADGGVIILRDPNGQIVDSVTFGPDMHLVPGSAQQGRSLERNMEAVQAHGGPSENSSKGHAAEWTSSADSRGGTAGEVNSIANLGEQGSINILPNPLLIGPQPQISRIQYRLPFTHAYVRIQVFDSQGRDVAVLLEADFSGAQGIAEWDARDYRGTPVAPGAYIVRLEASEYSGAAVYCEVDLLLVGH